MKTEHWNLPPKAIRCSGFIRNVYGKDNIDQLSEEQKNVTVEELFDYMCHGNDDTSMFGIDDSYSVEDALKIAAIRYELYMKRYEQYFICKYRFRCQRYSGCKNQGKHSQSFRV